MKKKYLYNTKMKSQNVIFKDKKGLLIIAGPCTFGSYDEIYSIAKELKKLGITYMRAGVFKSRTNPYSFQGMHEEGMKELLKVKKELNIKIVVELMTIEQVKKYGNDIDIIQIGSRNMYNYDLLKEVGKLKKPILLKRGFSATYHEWLMAAEYILNEGNSNVILCERGIRSFNSNETRNVLDLQAIPYIHRHSKLPIIVDPSHASGEQYMVPSMSKAAIVAGADGLIIETHINPKQSLCDSRQTVDMRILKSIINFKEKNKYED